MPTLIKAASWILNRIGARTLLTVTLLALVLVSITAGLQQVAPDLRDAPVVSLVFFAILVSWALARSRLSGRWAFFWLALLGLGLLIVNAGELGGDLAALARSCAQLGWEALRWQRGDPPLDASYIATLLQVIAQKLAGVSSGLKSWAISFSLGMRVINPMVTALIWGLVLWGVAVWAAWAIRRKENVLHGILPAAILFSASLSFARAPVFFLMPVLAGILLLLVTVGFTTQQRRWSLAGTDYSEEISFDLGLWALALVVLIVIGAWLASYLSPQKAFEAVRRLAEERSQETTQIGESLGLEVQPESGEGQSASPGVLPREHLLGSGPDLDQQIVMMIQPSDARKGYPGAEGEHPAPSHYWRSLTYDIYTGHGWATGQTKMSAYPANQFALPSAPPGYKWLEQDVTIVGNIGKTVYFSGLLARVDQDYQIDWRITPEGGNADFFTASLRRSPKDGAYHVYSHVLQIGRVQLRSASGEYPQWILNRYLQIPAELPQRVIDLAQQVSSGATSPYDKAEALEMYLRAFPYSLDVPMPPLDRDVADYFLFDLKKGFCDYYATAMVVMARAIGLPARLVIGYASGSYDPMQGRFTVSEADAHSWVEIYLPEFGWVEFEPTGGRPVIERPEDNPINTASETGGPTPPKPQPWQTWLRWLGWAGLAVAALALILCAWLVSDFWRLRRQSAPSALATLYRRLIQQGRRLEVPQAAGDTPHEFAAALSRHVTGLGRTSRTQRSLAASDGETRQVVNLYTQAIYSPHIPDKTAQRQAIWAWQGLRRRLWLARWLRWRLSLVKKI